MGNPDKAFLGIEPAKNLDGVTGVMILESVENSAAADAGLQTGDVIIAIDEKVVKDFEDLRVALASKKPGDEVTVDFLRMGKKSSKSIVLTSQADVYGSSKKVIVKKYEED
jgi:S1-C subfamily serine protease